MSVETESSISSFKNEEIERIKLQIICVYEEFAREVQRDNDYFNPFKFKKRIQVLEDKIFLLSSEISFSEIQGGFLIDGPRKQYYYYSGSGKWRAKGKNTYYFAKDLINFIDRIILEKREQK